MAAHGDHTPLIPKQRATWVLETDHLETDKTIYIHIYIYIFIYTQPESSSSQIFLGLVCFLQFCGRFFPETARVVWAKVTINRGQRELRQTQFVCVFLNAMMVKPLLGPRLR